jgi:outer membrane immunogenic protein
MNRFFLGALGLIAMATSASAADMAARPYAKAATVAPAAVYDWTGFYVGGHAGYGWGKAATELPTTFFGGDPAYPFQDMKGAVAGGQIGYNYQFNWLVLGVEGDISWTDIHQKYSTLPFPPSGTAFDAHVDWLASVRGRVGVAFSSVLIYGTGGAAWADLNLSQRSAFTPGVFGRNWFDSDGIVHNGWVVGGGLEWMFGTNWIARAEYLHYEFDSKLHFLPPSTLTGLSHDLKLDVVRAGISYKFGGPVVARY